MSGSKHTLGPFTVHKNVEGLKAPLAIHSANGGYRYIAEVWTNGADARLLAAAPDLLDACRAALIELNDPANKIGAIATLKRAIALATEEK